jgi:hypothetical protein
MDEAGKNARKIHNAPNAGSNYGEKSPKTTMGIDMVIRKI